jgi:hypothetical protein
VSDEENAHQLVELDGEVWEPEEGGYEGAPCADCGVDTIELDEFYMVEDGVWLAAGDVVGFLCIGCLEARRGRDFMLVDFTSVPLDRNPWGISDRLYARLGWPTATFGPLLAQDPLCGPRPEGPSSPDRPSLLVIR